MSSTVDTMVDDESSGPQAPQEIVNDFWENLVTKKPAKVTRIFPASLYQSLLPPQKSPGTVSGKNAAESYQAAADECRARVKRIVRECHRINEKFTDPDFDIASDMGTQNCLKGLMNWYEEDSSEGRSSIPTSALAGALTILNASGILVNPTMAIDLNATTALLNGNDDDESARGPKAVHRLDWIFEKPAFTIDGYSSSDLKQGQNGDCWFIAAVAAICSNPSLMDRVCVERDEECGVYGFVFNRDGEWIWTVVDDNLYLKYEDFDDDGDYYDPTGARERKYKKNYQTGSDALYFASCTDQNETWLPLLEKAYAKAHGDYDSIVGGLSGEAIEDLTGGVTTKILTDRILSKERLWKELIQANKEFLFSASSPSKGGDDTNARKGLALNHAYSVIKATEEEGENGEKHRLVLIRNPWGKRANASMGEWTGSWSDGSKEWTPYWLTKLNHTFGDDGLFWMAYDDLLAKFEMLDRTRIFDKEWTVVQTWTSVNISWVTGYLNTKFQVEIKKAGPTVFVLCQLDDRYFRGLQGKYEFNLHFLLQEEGTEPGEHIVRARSPWFGDRSISAEVDLEPGKYDVVLKIVGAQNNDASEVHDVVTRLAKNNPQKLRQIGLNYDIANAKGFVEETEEEKKKNEKKKKEAQEKKRKAKEEAEKEKAEFEAWKKEKAEKAAKKKAGKAAEEVKDKDAKSTSEETTKATESVEKPKDEAQSELETDDSEETDEESSKENQKEAKANPQPTSTEADTTSNEQHTKTPSTKSSTHAPASAPALAPSNSSVPAADSHSVSNDAGEAPPDPIPDEIVEKAKEKEKPADNKQNPWNAICVLGLRVYSQDPQVSIKLIKPKDPEEAAVLDADGATPAGATM